MAPWQLCLFKLFQLNRWFVATTNGKFPGTIYILVEEDLLSEHEIGNPHDTHAV